VVFSRIPATQLTYFGQLVDDILDYEEGKGTLSKPGGADLKLGLTTAPVLYAWEEHEAMGPLIQRKFIWEGDVELVSCFYLEIALHN
ncbi:hypothetical protein K439DRAFT_1635753, partial [Ramaria rubella]